MLGPWDRLINTNLSSVHLTNRRMDGRFLTGFGSEGILQSPGQSLVGTGRVLSLPEAPAYVGALFIPDWVWRFDSRQRPGPTDRRGPGLATSDTFRGRRR